MTPEDERAERYRLVRRILDTEKSLGLPAPQVRALRSRLLGEDASYSWANVDLPALKDYLAALQIALEPR